MDLHGQSVDSATPLIAVRRVVLAASRRATLFAVIIRYTTLAFALKHYAHSVDSQLYL